MLFLLLGCVDSWCARFNLDCTLESATITPGVDEDGDLWSASEDCDDANPASYPGAEEVCDYDDNNCDDVVDEGLGADWYPDGDEDGYGDASAAGQHRCEEGIAGMSADPSDCDDADGDIRPYRAEECDDGLDNDCDPGTTCELSGQNSAWSLGEATGGASDSGMGTSLARVRDASEGQADLLVGAPFTDSPDTDGGYAYGFNVADYGESYGFYKRTHWFVGDVAGARLGTAVDAAAEGDALVALLGAPGGGGSVEGAGSAVVFLGVGTGQHGSGTADGLFQGDEAGDLAGAAARLVGDYDGDGAEDALVGAPGRGEGAGAAWLLRGPLSGSLAENASLIEGEAAGDAAGSALLAADVDGSGVTDLVVGAPGGGAIYLLRDGEIPASLADAERYAGDAGSEFGAALAQQDLDGDGRPELLVGAPGAGYAAVLGDSGGGLGEISRCASGEAGDRAGASVSGAGDLDSDGYSELAVGAPLAEEVPIGIGAVYAVYGPLPAGCALQADSRFSLYASVNFGYFGTSVGSGSQLDGSSVSYLAIGAPSLLAPGDDLHGETGYVFAVRTPRL